jgi:hypothetical protein
MSTSAKQPTQPLVAVPYLPSEVIMQRYQEHTAAKAESKRLCKEAKSKRDAAVDLARQTYKMEKKAIKYTYRTLAVAPAQLPNIATQ